MNAHFLTGFDAKLTVLLTLQLSDAGQRALQLIKRSAQQLQVPDVALHDVAQVRIVSAGRVEAFAQLLCVFLDLCQRRVRRSLAERVLETVKHRRVNRDVTQRSRRSRASTLIILRWLNVFRRASMDGNSACVLESPETRSRLCCRIQAERRFQTA